MFLKLLLGFKAQEFFRKQSTIVQQHHHPWPQQQQSLPIPPSTFTSQDRLSEAQQELIAALSCPTTAVNALSDLHKLHDAFVNNALTQLDWARAVQNWASFLMRPELQRVEEASWLGGRRWCK